MGVRHWHEDIHDAHKEIGIGDGGTKDDNRCRANLLRCMRGLGCSVFALLCMGFLIAKETSKATTTMSPKSEQQQEATNYSSSAFGSRSPLVPASPPYSPPSLLPLLPSLPTPAPAQPPPAGPCATWCLDHPRSWRHKCVFRTCVGCPRCGEPSPPPPPPFTPPPPPSPHSPPHPPRSPDNSLCLAHITASGVRPGHSTKLWVYEGQGNRDTLQKTSVQPGTNPQWEGEACCVSLLPRADERTCFDIRDDDLLLHFGCTLLKPPGDDEPREVELEGGAVVRFIFVPPPSPSPPTPPAPPLLPPKACVHPWCDEFSSWVEERDSKFHKMWGAAWRWKAPWEAGCWDFGLGG